MKKNVYKIYLFIIIGLCSLQTSIAQTTIAYWNFDDSDLYIDGGTTDNQGKMIQNSAAGTYTFPAGVGAGFACSSNKWEAGLGVWAVATYDYYYDPIVTTGYGCLSISSVQRSSLTGPKNFTMEYSFDSWTWYTVPGAAVITVGNDYVKGVVSNVSLPSSCDNQPMVFIRWAMTDLTAVGGGNVASTGTSRIDNVLIQGYPVPDPAAMISGLISVSQGQSGVSYSVPPIANATSYNWYLPAGATIVSGANTNSIVVDFDGSASSGNVSVEGVNTCGTGIIYDLYVTVNTGIAQPVITPLGNTSLCEGSSLSLQCTAADSYLWSDGETTQSISISPTAGSYTYSVDVVINGNGATSNGLAIQVNPLPQTHAGMDIAYCSGDSMQLGSSAIPGNSYSWSPANGLSDASISDPYMHLINTSNSPSILNYILTETINYSGCLNTDTVEITINPLPISQAGNDVSYCNGDSAQIGSAYVQGNTYLWSPSNGLSNAGISNPYVHAANSSANPILQNYSLQTSNSSGCKDSSIVQVIINPNPIADAGNTVTIYAGDSVMLHGNGGTQYLWSPSTSLSNAAIDMPYAKPSITTLYTLVVSDINSCKASDTVSVIVINISTGLQSEKNISKKVEVFPNPFSTSTEFRISDDGKPHNYKFVLYDMQANQIRLIDHLQQKSFLMMRDNLPGGMYMFKVFEGGIKLYEGKVIVQ